MPLPPPRRLAVYVVCAIVGATAFVLGGRALWRASRDADDDQVDDALPPAPSSAPSPAIPPPPEPPAGDPSAMGDLQ